MIQSGSIRHKKKPAEGLLANISLLTKIKEGAWSSTGCFRDAQKCRTSLGPQRGLGRMEPTHLEGEIAANGQEPGFYMTSVGH